MQGKNPPVDDMPAENNWKLKIASNFPTRLKQDFQD
jgi:hypothetical protein